MANAGWAHPEILADPAWVAAHLTDPDVVILDCDLPPAYARLHIPGAVAAPSRYWKGPGNDSDLFGIDGERFATLIGQAGVGNDTTVVAYDGAGGLYAARLWWTLDRYGHRACKILNGGLDAWYAEGRPLTREPATRPARTFTAQPADDHWCATIDDVRASIGQEAHVFWDVRSDAEWDGSNPRGTRRGGRIPGARHLEWVRTLTGPVRRLREAAELRADLEALGITPDQAVTTYCQGGIRAAEGLLVLRLLGYERIRLYDGSWAEYGNALADPIETDETAGRRGGGRR